jgi:hypothetical protein
MPRSRLGEENVYDPDLALQSELEEVKDNNTGNFVPATMNNWELWKRLGGDIGNARVFPVSVGRNSNVTNTYLRSGEVPTNLAPIVLPFDCSLIAVAVSTWFNESWIFRVRDGITFTNIASLTVSNSNTAYKNDYTGINLSAGDTLAFYVEGNSVSRPSAYVYLQRGTET